MTVLNNYYGDVPSGWSPQGGQTKSAYVGPDFSPSESSSGSAVGLSAGFCAASIGCETIGSIVSSCTSIWTRIADLSVSPARKAGLYALKPSGGLVSNEGIIPVSKRMDTAGPMGKTTWDVAALLDQMVNTRHESYATVVDNAFASHSRPLRIGIPRKGFFAAENRKKGPDYAPELKAQAEAIFDSVVTALQALIIQDPADIPDENQAWRDTEHEPYKEAPWVFHQTTRMLQTEFYEGINEHLATRVGGAVHSLADLVKWNEEHPVRFSDLACVQWLI